MRPRPSLPSTAALVLTAAVAIAALLVPAASAAQHGDEAAPAAHEPSHAASPASAHTARSASTIFSGLFKHLEPHAVGGVWFGGSKGFGWVKPYATDASGAPARLDAHGHPVAFHGHDELRAHYAALHGGGTGWLIYNINAVQWLAGAVLFAIMALVVARKSKRLGAEAPRGFFQHLVESVVLYVRDDMVYAVMGKEQGRRFVPLFLTQFFFILVLNIFGLLPLAAFAFVGMDFMTAFAATATANLAVTAGLALTTLLWIHLSGIREHGFVHHWKNFLPHGLPWFVLPIIIPVEVLGMLVKPAALTIRLFANMTAGHLVMLGFFGLIYLFGSYLVGAPVLLVAIAISCLELFVCFVQAYIFTYLSVIFVGASVHPEH